MKMDRHIKSEILAFIIKKSHLIIGTNNLDVYSLLSDDDITFVARFKDYSKVEIFDAKKTIISKSASVEDSFDVLVNVIEETIGKEPCTQLSRKSGILTYTVFINPPISESDFNKWKVARTI